VAVVFRVGLVGFDKWLAEVGLVGLTSGFVKVGLVGLTSGCGLWKVGSVM
jgi:hypothetical protein